MPPADAGNEAAGPRHGAALSYGGEPLLSGQARAAGEFRSHGFAIPAPWGVTMTSATIKPAGGTSGRHAEGRGFGLVVFASAVLAVVGFFNLLYGIAAVANSHVFVANAHYVVGGLYSWGWVTLILGALQLLAAAGVVVGNQLARWFGVVVVGLSAIDMMFFIPAYPFWALMIIAVDVVALYGLCAYGSRANLSAA